MSFVLVNSAFARLMGHPVEALLGRSDFDFVPAEEARLFWARDDEVLASGEPRENQEILTDAAGREHRLVARKSRVIAPRGTTPHRRRAVRRHRADAGRALAAGERGALPQPDRGLDPGHRHS